MNTTYSDYLTIARDTARSIETIRRQPMVARETEYYLKKIGQIKTAEEFLSDRRLMTYAMTAFGLGDMSYAKGFVRKLLKEGTDQPEAFANQLTDKRYLDFAKAFDFKRYGAATTAFGTAQTGVVESICAIRLNCRQGLQTRVSDWRSILKGRHQNLKMRRKYWLTRHSFKSYERLCHFPIAFRFMTSTSRSHFSKSASMLKTLPRLPS